MSKITLCKAGGLLIILLLIATVSARPVLDAMSGQVKEVLDIIRLNESIIIKLSEKNHITFHRGYDPNKCQKLCEDLTQNGTRFVGISVGNLKPDEVCNAIGAGPIFMNFYNLSFNQVANMADGEIMVRARGFMSKPERSVSTAVIFR